MQKTKLQVKDFDSLLVLLLTVSIFAPFYFSVITTCGIAVMTMMNCKKRVKVFSSPYSKFLLGFLMIPFFVSATYNNYWGMLYSIVLIAGVICGFYVRSVMTRPLFNNVMDTACVASVWCAFIAIYQKISSYSVAPQYRPISAFHNANSYGMFSANVLPRDKSCPCYLCSPATGRTPTCKFDGTCGKGYNSWKSQHDQTQETIRQKKSVEDGLYMRHEREELKALKYPHAKSQRGW